MEELKAFCEQRNIDPQALINSWLRLMQLSVEELNDESGVALIKEERRQQIEVHGRTIELDALLNTHHQLSDAASKLCDDDVGGYWHTDTLPVGWDQGIWDKMTNKPYKERLIIAGALIAAEIDRLNYNVAQEDKANETNSI
jgi:hypothetical protein